MKTAHEVMAEGVDCCGPMKTIHKGFCLATLEKLMENWTGGSYIFMTSNPRVPVGRPIMAIGYKYNYRNVLGFIATEGAGSTEPDDTYLSHFPDFCSNFSILPVVCPHFLGRYVNSCNTADNHNRILQSDLAFENYWVT